MHSKGRIETGSDSRSRTAETGPKSNATIISADERTDDRRHRLATDTFSVSNAESPIEYVRLRNRHVRAVW
ncbi:hypothetical protein NJ7G_3787 [Natrinema sp. J7-2]|nr:hypothetical protein NJ7G_3787 [Natrinema sp. J7-2]